MKEMFEGSFRANAQLIKYLKKLPEHQRLIEIEQFIEAREKEAPSYFMDKGFKNFFFQTSLQLDAKITLLLSSEIFSQSAFYFDCISA